MKQIVQNARTGALEILEVPMPVPGPGQVLVRNHFSVVSTGTETLSLEFARKSMLAKARSRPDLTKQVVRKLREEGPLPTYRTVMNRLDAPQPLGYSCAGRVESIGRSVTRFSPGDRVACGGAGYANHAEFVVVPENLTARVPDAVATEHAAFATIGAIALQGVRVAAPTLGEIAAVIGLGLIGQFAVQLLCANGCRVLGVDLDPERVKQGIEQGAEWGATPSTLSPSWKEIATNGFGADFALVAASATTAAPLELAAELCRARGRLAVVGAMPMELDRRTFYEKELQLAMSMSYGPGRYDRSYEEQGLDYPLPYVRWTENRNLQAFLQLVARGAVKPDLLRPNIRPFEDALETYEAMAGHHASDIAALFRYDIRAQTQRVVELRPKPRAVPAESIGVAFLGAGNYAKAVLLPAVSQVARARRVALVTATGASAHRTGERFSFERCGTDPEEAFSDDAVDLVFVATRHDSHAALAMRALRAGKAVWIEKPPALTPEELDELEACALETEGFLMVGYNRRFSPHTAVLRKAFARRGGPMALRYTICAGAPPRGSWVIDPREGGGRVIGEMCHFVDLSSHLVGSTPISVAARRLGHDPVTDDSTIAMLGYPDGSTAVIEYLSNSTTELPKERMEISADGRTAGCENFRRTWIAGGRETKTFNQDKGQEAAVAAALEAVRHGTPSPIPLHEILATSRATFAIVDSSLRGEVVDLVR